MSYFGRSNRVAKQVAKKSSYSKPLRSAGGMYDDNSSLIGKKGKGVNNTDKSEDEVARIKAEIAAKIQKRNRTKTIAILIAGSMLLLATMMFLYVSENG